MLNPHIFKQIQSKVGPCKTDTFTPLLTKQLPRFFTWRPHLEAEGIDTTDFHHEAGNFRANCLIYVSQGIFYITSVASDLLLED